MDREERNWLIFCGIIGLILTGIAAAPRVPQPEAYHHFAADHDILAIPNFWNVLSNIPFLVVAGIGFRNMRQPGPIEKAPAGTLVFLAGVFLTALGSAYYHWQPTTDRLFWDRLPMTVGFAAVTAALIGHRLHPRWGRKMLWPLVAAGALSVLYWRWTESLGKGNLVPYGVVQYGTILLALAILLLFPRPDSTQKHLWIAFSYYALAKILETGDRQIAEALQIIGGHPFKHLAAAAACYYLYRALFVTSPASRQD